MMRAPHTAIQCRTGYVQANGQSLYYEDWGRESDPAIVMVMGLAAQLIVWPTELVRSLAAQGYRVIRFDNRDIGWSSETVDCEPRHLARNWLKYRLGRPVEAPYTLYDMVEDSIGLMDVLGIQKAHWVGASMGGMIAQLAASLHPHRALSLTTIMSSTNERYLQWPALSVLRGLLRGRGPIHSAEQAGEALLAFWQHIKSPALPADPQSVYRRAMAAYQRSFRPKAPLRHTLAVMATGGFAHLLNRVRVPALVIHGSVDPLIRLDGGQDSARHLPNARLKVVDGMGHELPEALIDDFAAWIGDHVSATTAPNKEAPWPQGRAA